MLSEEYILTLIEKYSQTAAGKAEIAKRKKGKFDARVATEGAKKQSLKQMSQIGNDMRDILFRKISKIIKSFKIEDIIVGAPEPQGDKYSISISFNEDALRRESLDPDRYPDGVSNIVKLFINGYDARGAVYGVWKGHGDEEIWSLRHRDPNDFMEKAVEEFNSKYTDVAHAETTNEYKTNI